MTRVTFVIPAYNEGPRLAAGFARLAPTLDVWGRENCEVIVVDDGSSDNTLARISELYGSLPHLRVVRHDHNLGKGAALRLGLRLATSPAVITADADMAIHPEHSHDVVAALEHVDVAPGARAVDGHIAYDHVARTWAGALFNRLARHYTGTTLRDTQCGFKGFRLASARLLSLLSLVNGFAIDLEMLYLADQLGLRVAPLAVTWDDVSGSSVHLGRDTWTVWRDLRALRRTRYVNPVVTLAPDLELATIRRVAMDLRIRGLVLARGHPDSLLVLPREGALDARALADALNGAVRTTTLSELRHRDVTAI